MPKLSNSENINEIQHKHISTPTENPPAGYVYLYFKSDNLLYAKDSAGVETQIAGSTITDTDDVPEGSNLYYTEARVSANTDVVANTSARHTHANQAELDLITDGDHDTRTDNPHNVTMSQVAGAGTVGQLLINDGSGWVIAAPVIDPIGGSIVVDPTTGTIVVER